MKKVIVIFAFMIMAFVSLSQVNFMGIPVEGDAPAMLKQLKQKGFKDAPVQYGENSLVGTFFNREALIKINLNSNNSVTSVSVCFMAYINNFEGLSRLSAIRLYNDLLSSFNDKETYWGISYMFDKGLKTQYYNKEIDNETNLLYDISMKGIEFHSYYKQRPLKNLNAVHFAIAMDEFNYDKYFVLLLYENLDNKTFGSDDL